MKKRIAIVVLLGGSLLASAQRNTWTIGVYSGVRGNLIQVIDKRYLSEKVINAPNFSGFGTPKTVHHFSMSPIEFNVQYKITDKFSVCFGVGYINYQTKGRYYSSIYHQANEIETYVSSYRDAIQIPLTFQYAIPLKNTGFSFFSKLGLIMDISFAPYLPMFYSLDNIEDNLTTIRIDSISFENPTLHRGFNYQRDFNLLINAGIGFAYQFKSGVGLSLSGEYNIGTMRTDHLYYSIHFINETTNDLDLSYEYSLYNRNEYWNVLFGITYTFKKKREIK